MLKPEDKASIATLIAAYQQGRTTWEGFIKHGKEILRKFHPEWDDDMVDQKILDIVRRIE